MTTHVCVFPEIEIEERDFSEGDPLKAGMRVVAPCADCGEDPLTEMKDLQRQVQEAGDALLAAKPIMPLFHWSPTPRRKQIQRYGLRPHSRVTTCTGDDNITYPVICFADAPSWAWALSAEMKWTPKGSWDLWQTDVGRLTDPIVLPSEDRMSGIYEVRTEHRVFKRDLWYVGSRIKE